MALSPASVQICTVTAEDRHMQVGKLLLKTAVIDLHIGVDRPASRRIDPSNGKNKQLGEA